MEEHKAGQMLVQSSYAILELSMSSTTVPLTCLACAKGVIHSSLCLHLALLACQSQDRLGHQRSGKRRGHAARRLHRRLQAGRAGQSAEPSSLARSAGLCIAVHTTAPRSCRTHPISQTTINSSQDRSQNPPPTNVEQTSNKPRTNLEQTSNKPRTNPEQTSNKPRTNLEQTSKKPGRNLEQTSNKNLEHKPRTKTSNKNLQQNSPTKTSNKTSSKYLEQMPPAETSNKILEQMPPSTTSNKNLKQTPRTNTSNKHLEQKTSNKP